MCLKKQTPALCKYCLLTQFILFETFKNILSYDEILKRQSQYRGHLVLMDLQDLVVSLPRPSVCLCAPHQPVPHE